MSQLKHKLHWSQTESTVNIPFYEKNQYPYIHAFEEIESIGWLRSAKPKSLTNPCHSYTRQSPFSPVHK